MITPENNKGRISLNDEEAGFFNSAESRVPDRVELEVNDCIDAILRDEGWLHVEVSDLNASTLAGLDRHYVAESVQARLLLPEDSVLEIDRYFDRPNDGEVTELGVRGCSVGSRKVCVWRSEVIGSRKVKNITTANHKEVFPTSDSITQRRGLDFAFRVLEMLEDCVDGLPLQTAPSQMPLLVPELGPIDFIRQAMSVQNSLSKMLSGGSIGRLIGIDNLFSGLEYFNDELNPSLDSANYRLPCLKYRPLVGEIEIGRMAGRSVLRPETSLYEAVCADISATEDDS